MSIELGEGGAWRSVRCNRVCGDGQTCKARMTVNSPTDKEARAIAKHLRWTREGDHDICPAHSAA